MVHPFSSNRSSCSMLTMLAYTMLVAVLVAHETLSSSTPAALHVHPRARARARANPVIRVQTTSSALSSSSSSSSSSSPVRFYLPSRLHARRLGLSTTATQASSSNDQNEAATQTPSQPQPQEATPLTTDQLEFLLGYLNQHHSDLLRDWAIAFSDIGTEMAKANVWSGGSFTIKEAVITHVDTETLQLQVTCVIRGKSDRTDTVAFDLDSHPVASRQRNYKALHVVPEYQAQALPYTIDVVVRKLCRLCHMVHQPTVTGKLLQLALQLNGLGIGKIPENMYLNQVPHNRYVRQYFYETATAAVQQAVLDCAAASGDNAADNSDKSKQSKQSKQPRRSNRMLVKSEFPEMNPAMDSYRIGTLLEMARAMVISLAEENLRVRLCVQGSMGAGIFTGLPKQLAGVYKLMQMMDWESEEGERNEGMVGTFCNFGNIGKEFVVNEQRDSDNNIVQHQDDVFILLCPQNMVGTDSSIIPWLEEMVEAAGDRPVILINPDLTDKVSAAGQQSVRGRQQRMDFVNSFETVYHWQNIYVSGTSYFPILGSITKMMPNQQWIAYQRRDFASSDNSASTGASDEGAGEIYVPVLAGETKPTGQDILEAFER